MMDLTPDYLEAVYSFQRELPDIVLATHRSKPVGLPPNEHASTLEELNDS